MQKERKWGDGRGDETWRRCKTEGGRRLFIVRFDIAD